MGPRFLERGAGLLLAVRGRADQGRLPTHLLTPQRIDQLVCEHLDPADYPARPTELIAAHEAPCVEAERLGERTAALAPRGPHLFETESSEARTHYSAIETLDARINALEAQITARL
ncbi:hypothetical protein [Cumulibacter soli]|uniref:hypothetical protein n=1 Tax=Cumulibacter soli TaxID=2546344 RepID=UPI0010689C7F|nr:hypothetical protein [Cumulibacter soli]